MLTTSSINHLKLTVKRGMSSLRTYPKLYLIGDSNTQFAFSNGGFATQLANDYIRRLDVVNRGFSGYTSEHLRTMAPQLLRNDHINSSPIHTATVLLGSNDAVLPNLDARHVTPSRYKDNLETIVKCLRDNNVPNIVLISPPPVDDERWNKRCAELYGSPGACCNNSVRMYADACSNLSKELDLHYVDLYGEMMKHDSWCEFFGDGLHFNESGHIVVYQKLKEVLSTLLSDLPFVYPDWKEIVGEGIEVLN